MFAQEGDDSGLISFDTFHQGRIPFGVGSVNGRAFRQKRLDFSNAARRGGGAKPLGHTRLQAPERLKPR